MVKISSPLFLWCRKIIFFPIFKSVSMCQICSIKGYNLRTKMRRRRIFVLPPRVKAVLRITTSIVFDRHMAPVTCSIVSSFTARATLLNKIRKTVRSWLRICVYIGVYYYMTLFSSIYNTFITFYLDNSIILMNYGDF